MAAVERWALSLCFFFTGNFLTAMEPPSDASQSPSKKARGNQLFERDGVPPLTQKANLHRNSTIPLHDAVFSGRTEEVSRILLNADVNLARPDGITALHIATFKGDKNLIAVLLKAGAQVDAAKCEGSTALHVAAQKGYEDVVEILLAAGAHVMSKRRNNATPLHLAAQNGHAKVVEIYWGPALK